MITMGYSNIPYKNYFFYYANDIHEVCKRELHVLGCYVILHSVKKHPVAVFLYSLYSTPASRGYMYVGCSQE